MPSRRRFIKGFAALGAVACSSSKDDSSEFIGEVRRLPEPEPWSPEDEINEMLFPYGIQVGDVLSESAIVSVQTNSMQVSWRLVQQQLPLRRLPD